MGAPASGDRSDSDLATALAAFVASAAGIPEAGVRITGLRRLAGGASRELWSLDAVLAGDGEGGAEERLPLVLRRDPAGRVGEGDLALEFRLLEAAHAAGVPVPRPRWCAEDAAALGAPGYLMDRVPGETIPRRLLRDADYARTREVLAAQLGGILARIHAIDPDAPALAGLAARGAESAKAEVERLGEGLRRLAVEPHPVLELAERWLLARAPEPRRRTLVHGDYRVGNVLFGAEGARAVLDWELAHVGDPVEDLGWLCVRAWRFGSELPVGGVGTREALVGAYVEAGGAPVDPDALRFWEACGNFKLALVFITQARVFLDGVASIELASLGRRIAEAEDELLRFLEEDAA